MSRGPALLPVLALALLLLPGCGLEPVYSGGSQGIAATALGNIAIAPIPDKNGYMVTQALREQFGPADATPQFRLEVELSQSILGFGIRDNNTIAAERVTLRARYQLVDGNGKVVLLATTGSDISIDRVSSDYAVVAAETSAFERLSVVIAQQMTQRLTVFAKSGAMVPVGPVPTGPGLPGTPAQEIRTPLNPAPANITPPK
jgi:LPS-assembly lipoprotein